MTGRPAHRRLYSGEELQAAQRIDTTHELMHGDNWDAQLIEAQSRRWKQNAKHNPGRREELLNLAHYCNIVAQAIRRESAPEQGGHR